MIGSSESISFTVNSVILKGGVPIKMSTPVHTSIDRTVSDISPSQRETIEELIGSDLALDQRVFILAYRPGVEPSESEKASARFRIHELIKEARENVLKSGVTDSEVESSIEEAIHRIDK